MTGSKIVRGNYSGYIKFVIQESKKSDRRKAFTMVYDHGHWGGIISKGAQGVPRYAATFPQADLIHSGHTHDSWIIPHPHFYLCPNKNVVKTRNKWLIRTGTYKRGICRRGRLGR